MDDGGVCFGGRGRTSNLLVQNQMFCRIELPRKEQQRPPLLFMERASLGSPRFPYWMGRQELNLHEADPSDSEKAVGDHPAALAAGKVAPRLSRTLSCSLFFRACCLEGLLRFELRPSAWKAEMLDH